MSPLPPGYTQRHILMDLFKGAVIRVEYVSESANTKKKIYRLSSTNQAIRASVVERLLEEELIRPNDDGLPGIGESQTYSLWRPSEGGA